MTEQEIDEAVTVGQVNLGGLEETNTLSLLHVMRSRPKLIDPSLGGCRHSRLPWSRYHALSAHARHAAIRCQQERKATELKPPS